MDGGWDVYLGHSLQVVLGVALLAAGATKLRQPGRFAAAVGGYEVVPPRLAAPSAVAVMGSEVLVGLALLSGRGVAVAAPAAGALFAAFAVAVGINLRRGASVPCGCFGSADERVSPRTLARLGLLLAATTVLVIVGAVSGGVPLDVARLAADGRAGFERLVATLAIGAFLSAMGVWLLHVGELAALVGSLRPGRRHREGT